jgi:hypothetical protein
MVHPQATMKVVVSLGADGGKGPAICRLLFYNHILPKLSTIFPFV